MPGDTQATRRGRALRYSAGPAPAQLGATTDIEARQDGSQKEPASRAAAAAARSRGLAPASPGAAALRRAPRRRHRARPGGGALLQMRGACRLQRLEPKKIENQPRQRNAVRTQSVWVSGAANRPLSTLRRTLAQDLAPCRWRASARALLTSRRDKLELKRFRRGITVCRGDYRSPRSAALRGAAQAARRSSAAPGARGGWA